jgi:hypothetical protein
LLTPNLEDQILVAIRIPGGYNHTAAGLSVQGEEDHQHFFGPVHLRVFGSCNTGYAESGAVESDIVRGGGAAEQRN